MQGRKDLACADLQQAGNGTPPQSDGDLAAYCSGAGP
jgi:hypothetical protein